MCPCARARAWRRCVRTFWLAPWAVRRARVAPVLHRRLWIDAGCVAYGGGCSIDFARAPASRGGCWPAIARGTALRDGEEARPRPGARPMHRRSAPLQAAVVRQFTPCNARAREGFCVRGRARVGRLKEPAKRRARPSSLAASRPRTVGGRPPIGLPQRGAAPRAVGNGLLWVEGKGGSRGRGRREANPQDGGATHGRGQARRAAAAHPGARGGGREGGAAHRGGGRCGGGGAKGGEGRARI